jgi:hypothetical protein
VTALTAKRRRELAQFSNKPDATGHVTSGDLPVLAYCGKNASVTFARASRLRHNSTRYNDQLVASPAEAFAKPGSRREPVHSEKAEENWIGIIVIIDRSMTI